MISWKSNRISSKLSPKGIIEVQHVNLKQQWRLIKSAYLIEKVIHWMMTDDSKVRRVNSNETDSSFKLTTCWISEDRDCMKPEIKWISWICWISGFLSGVLFSPGSIVYHQRAQGRPRAAGSPLVGGSCLLLIKIISRTIRGVGCQTPFVFVFEPIC